MKRSFIHILVGLCIVTAAGITIFLILEQENRIVAFRERGKYFADSIYTGPADRAAAEQFSDSVLPALKQKGLIIDIRQDEMQTVVTVSGAMWKKRSPFFKDEFLTHASLYNKVHGFPSSLIVVDHRNGHLLARIVPPGHNEFLE